MEIKADNGTTVQVTHNTISIQGEGEIAVAVLTHEQAVAVLNELYKHHKDPRKFTDPEMEWLEGHPDALELVADYHDLQMTQGEPMGFDCSGNQKRYDELKERAGTIRAAWENGDKI